MKRSYFLVLAGLLVVNVAVVAQESQASSETQVRELMKLTGAAQVGMQVMDMMTTQMKSIIPDAPVEFWTEFRKEVDPEDLIEQIIPIYQRHLTADEVDFLIDFYSSPMGRSFVAKQPAIMQESMIVGQQWGQALAQRAMSRMQERQKAAE